MARDCLKMKPTQERTELGAGDRRLLTTWIQHLDKAMPEALSVLKSSVTRALWGWIQVELSFCQLGLTYDSLWSQ